MPVPVSDVHAAISEVRSRGEVGPDSEAARDLAEALRAYPSHWQLRTAVQHVTASALLVRPADQTVLLTLHAVNKRWAQLGGHLEPHDESLAAAVLREAHEESGVAEMTLGPLLGIGRYDGARCHPPVRRTHFDVRYLVLTDQDETTISDESDDLAWWPLASLPDVRDPQLDLMAHQALTHLSGDLGHVTR
jgi:ADP-ribose pyrophosphatase YjhB (NUDIX family)